MRYRFIFLAFLLGIGALLNTHWVQAKENEAELKGVDAIEAMKIANQWKWTKKGIKSYVTFREIVFKFPNGTVKKVPLPEDKMVVAVAPYISRTHT